MDINTLLKAFALSVILWVFLCVHHVSGQTVVEGFVGGYVILPCTLTPNGDLKWQQTDTKVIMVKPASGKVIIGDAAYKGHVSLVNGVNLRISPLKRPRDGTDEVVNIKFACLYTSNPGVRTETTLKLIDPVKITGVSISGAINGRITVTVGTSKTLTCFVSEDPKPAPSYTWSINGGTVIGQTSSSYTLNPDKSMKTIKCTATNRITDESVFSEEETTATLNVRFLDRPLIKDVSPIIENSTVTLQCSAKGNPQPRFEWRKSTSSEVLHEKALYVIEKVQRSAAGTYRCTVKNAVTKHSLTTDLIVQYPPDVSVSYDKTTQTLTCRAEGVPGDYNFSQWEHWLDGNLLQKLGKELDTKGASTLKLPGKLTYEDTGYYVCQVSNGIKSLQRGQVFVTPQSPAIFEKQIQTLTWKEGDNNSISVPFYTYSDTPNVNVMWKKSGESTVLTSHREETGPVSLMIRDQSVSIEGTVTVLTLRNVTQSDKGNYTVTVTNNINGVSQSNQVTFSVFVTLPPTSSTVTITDTSTISVGNDQANKQSGVEVAPIAGGAGGAVVLILVIVILIIVVRRRSANNKNADNNKDKKKSAKKENARENEAFSDDRWNHPDAEIAVNDLYGSYSGAPDKKGHKKDKGKKPNEQKRNSEKEDGRENEAFSDDRWKQPDAEIAVNDLYGSCSGGPDKKGHKPAANKPAKTKKTLPKSKGKLGNSTGVTSENCQTPKNKGLNYQEVGFDKKAGKPKFHPQESPVTYADISFIQENRSGVASVNELKGNAENRGLNYQQVEFDKKAGNPKVHPQESPVTYADISFLQSQKTEIHPIQTNADPDNGTREDVQTQHGVADNTANDLYESELPSREIPPRDVKPPRPGRKPAQMSKPFPTKKPLPKVSSIDD